MNECKQKGETACVQEASIKDRMITTLKNLILTSIERKLLRLYKQILNFDTDRILHLLIKILSRVEIFFPRIIHSWNFITVDIKTFSLTKKVYSRQVFY